MTTKSDIGEPETSGEDSVSLTSTVMSDGEGKEYEVDQILAEWETDGVMWYLTRWVGYPDVEATWQLRDTFNPSEEGGHDVFKDWQERKMRISRGYEKPYDIEDFERRRDAIEREVAFRRARRRRKKARLNQMIDALSSDSQESIESSNEGHQRNFESRNSSASTLTRQGSEIRQTVPTVSEPTRPKSRWTDTEQRVFMKGLQDANGPYWDKMVAWYGVCGSINQLLKDKPLEDMQMQLQALRREFARAGRDPPGYMNAPKPRKNVEGSTRQKPRHKRQKRIASKGEGSSSDGRTSTDSNMEEIKANKRSQATKVALKTKTSSASTSSEILAKSTNPKGIEKEYYDPTPIVKEAAKSKEKDKGTMQENVPLQVQTADTTKKNSSATLGSKTQSLTRPEAPRRPYSGTARAPTSKPNESLRVTGKSRTGVPGVGPARFLAPQRRPSTVKPTAKTNVGGIDVTANWSGEAKIRKAKTLPTTNISSSTDKPLKTFKTLGARNNVLKWRRNEPAPDPTQLVFVDPKTGKAPKQSVTSPVGDSNTTIALKSPFQRYQEELAAKETQDVIPNDYTNAGVDDIDDNLCCDDAVSGTVLGDTSANEPNNRDLMNVNLNVTEEMSHTSANSAADAPTRPRAYSAHSLQPPNQHTLPYTAQPATMIGQTWLPAQSSQLALMGNPTPLETRDLFDRFEDILVIGNLRIGPALEDAGKMKLTGFDRDVKQLLLTVKDRSNPLFLYFEFNKLCTATDYQRYWHSDFSKYLGSGQVIPYPENRGKYKSIAEFLAYHVSIGIFLAKDFTMLIWPAHSSIWGFLENGLAPFQPGAVLRFAVREPMSFHLVDQIEISATSRLRIENVEAYNKINARISSMPVQPEEHAINLVFREVFNIEFDQLIAPNGPQKRPLGKNFFLCFVPANCEQYEPDESKRQVLRSSTSEEHDLFVQFLRANGAETIFSVQDVGSYEPVKTGSWRYFIENIKSGAVIIHESCGRPDQLPYLAKFLSKREGGVNVWMTSLSSVDPVDQSHSHLVRCFPHGGVIFLTVSLMMYHPDEALRILRWFRLDQLPNKQSGTWKIALRPRVREWLLDIHNICCERTWHSPFGDFNLQVYADINVEILLLLDRDVEPFGLMVETCDTEVPLPEAPVVAEIQLLRGRKEWTGDSFETAKIDHDAVRWNDDELIQWFSEWAGVHLQDYRRFQVVLGYPKGNKDGDRLTRCYEKGYGYLEDGPNEPGRQERGLFKRPDGTEIRSAWERNFLEILSYDQYLARNKIPDQARLNQKDADRRQKDKDALSQLQAEAEVEWQEERAVVRDALATIMQICRDRGGTEEQARAAGRRHLLWRRDEQGTASDREVEECAIDMDWKQPNQYTWTGQVISGTKEEGEAALEEQKKEAKRLADKEVLSGTKERERRWEDEITFWAARDREKK